MPDERTERALASENPSARPRLLLHPLRSPPDALRAQTARAAIVSLPLWLLVVVLQTSQTPTADNLAAQDPIMATLGLAGGAFWSPLVGLATIAAWIYVHRASLGDRAAWRRDLGFAAAGVLTAALVAGSLRLAVGPELPTFIPPEESSRPGLMLGLSAGMLEEWVFRLGTLPLAYLALRPRIGAKPAALAAAILTAVLFALSHELPPDGGTFDPGHVMTRIALPGVIMSAAYFVLSPSYIVAAHGTAHLFIPLLFH